MHRPATFQDMLLLAERADQAFMSDRNGSLKNKNYRSFNNFSSFGGTRGGNNNGGRGNGNFGGRNVNYTNVS